MRKRIWMNLWMDFGFIILDLRYCNGAPFPSPLERSFSKQPQLVGLYLLDTQLSKKGKRDVVVVANHDRDDTTSCRLVPLRISLLQPNRNNGVIEGGTKEQTELAPSSVSKKRSSHFLTMVTSACCSLTRHYS